MTVNFAGTPYACDRAVKCGNTATLYLSDGGTVEFECVHDWDAFILEDGEWSLPAVTVQEQMRADIDFLAAMTGVSL